MNDNTAGNDARTVGEARDDLAWNAFLYVSGELSEQDAESFEERLVSDEEAAEAVVRATELGRILVAARTTTPPVRRSGSLSRSLGWMAAGAAVATLVFSLTGFGLREGPEPTRVPVVAKESPPDSDLVGAWRRMQGQGSWTAPTASWRTRPSFGTTASALPTPQFDRLPSWVGSLDEDEEQE